jgi:hypothetical protein
VSVKWLELYEKTVSAADDKAPLIPLFDRLAEWIDIPETWPFLIAVSLYVRNRDTDCGESYVEFLTGMIPLLVSLITRGIGLSDRASLWNIVFGCSSELWFGDDRVQAAGQLMD